MLAFWNSILEYIINCHKMVHHVTAAAIANSFSVSNTNHDGDYVLVAVSLSRRQ